MRRRLYRFAAIAACSMLLPGLAIAETVWQLNVAGSGGAASVIRVQVRDAQGDICETSAPCDITAINSVGDVRDCIAAGWNRLPGECSAVTPPCDACPAGCKEAGFNGLLVSQTNTFTLWACSCVGLSCTDCDNPAIGFTELTDVAFPVAGTGFLVTAFRIPHSVPAASPAALAVLLVLIVATVLLLRARRRRRSPPAPA